MSRPTKTTEDLDLFQVIEELWRNKVTILMTTFLGILVVFLVQAWFLDFPQYHTRTMVFPVKSQVFPENYVNSWNRFGLIIRKDPWLENIADEINNPQTMYKVLSRMDMTIPSKMPWLNPESSGQNLSGTSLNKDFQNRIVTRLGASHSYAELIFISDVPGGGEEISEAIINEAILSAFKKLQLNYFYTVSDHLYQVSRDLTLTWDSFVVETESSTPTYSDEKISNLTREIEEVGGFLRNLSNYQDEMPTPPISSIKKNLVDIHRDAGFEKLTLIHLVNHRHIASGAFVGLVFGLLISFLSAGYAQRKEN